MPKANIRLGRTWVLGKPKTVPKSVRDSVSVRGQEFVESYLKPKHIQPPPKSQEFNYLIDIFTKWRGINFYFMSKYACPSPRAITPCFEIGFARLEYMGNGNFNVSYMRHTEKWHQIASDVSFEDVLELMSNTSLLQP